MKCTYCNDTGKHLCPDVTEPILINCTNKACEINSPYWYYRYHSHTGSVSLFNTNEYDGRGAYSSRENALNAARKMLVECQRNISLKLLHTNNTLATLISDAEKIAKALVLLESE